MQSENRKPCAVLLDQNSAPLTSVWIQDLCVSFMEPKTLSIKLRLIGKISCRSATSVAVAPGSSAGRGAPRTEAMKPWMAITARGEKSVSPQSPVTEAAAAAPPSLCSRHKARWSAEQERSQQPGTKRLNCLPQQSACQPATQPARPRCQCRPPHPVKIAAWSWQCAQ